MVQAEIKFTNAELSTVFLMYHFADISNYAIHNYLEVLSINDLASIKYKSFYSTLITHTNHLVRHLPSPKITQVVDLKENGNETSLRTCKICLLISIYHWTVSLLRTSYNRNFNWTHSLVLIGLTGVNRKKII